MSSPFESLREPEVFWRDNYLWLLQEGYRLRPRFKPGWTAAWKEDKRYHEGLTEDSIPLNWGCLNDATRVSDGRHVVLKRILPEDLPELHIVTYFSQEALLSNPQNHCVPMLQSLHKSGDEPCDIIVLPLLREYSSPDFDTVGEVVDFIDQTLEGFAFLHEHRVAHLDIRIENIMMSPEQLGFGDFHFTRPQYLYDDDHKRKDVRAKFTRTERPPKYYIIDFGFSKQWREDEMPPAELPRPARDTTLPELKARTQPCNPFMCDVYYIGNLLRMEFTSFGHHLLKDNDRCGRTGVDFLGPLIEAMTKEVPEERITMAEASTTFRKIVEGLSASQLRGKVRAIPSEDEGGPSAVGTLADTAGWMYRRLTYVVRRLDPIPKRRSP